MGCHELNLNVYDFADNEAADDDHDAARIEQVLPHRIVEEHFGVARRNNVQNNQQRDRQAAENPSREPALRGVSANFTFNADAVSNHTSGAVENFGKIAAGFFLHQDRGNQEVQVLRWNAVAELQEGVPEGNADFLLVKA